MGIFLPCSSLALPLCRIGLVSCYGSVQEVSEPSLESPRPPMAVSRQGRRETSLIGCPPCTPACWRPYPSAPRGAPSCLLFPCSSLARHLLAVCSSLALPLLAPCSLRALCPACPPPCTQGQPGFRPFCPCAQGGVPAGQSPCPTQRGRREGCGKVIRQRLPFPHPSLRPLCPCSPPGGFPF